MECGKADAWQTAFEKSVPESENDKEETQSTEQDIKFVHVVVES